MRIWIAAAVVVALAAIGLVVAPYAVDWERFRLDIEAAIEDETGHHIAINGPIDLSLLPRPTLIAKDVTITNDEDESPGFELSAQQIDLGMRPGPLMVGRPIVDTLKLTRPLLAFDQQSSDDLRSWPPKLDRWNNLRHANLNLITINDGRITLIGQNGDEKSVVNELSLTLALETDNGPIEAAGLFKSRQHRFSIAADIGAYSRDGSSTLKLQIDTQNGVDETTSLSLNGVLHRNGSGANLEGRFDLAGLDLRASLEAISAVTGYSSTFLSLAPNQAYRLQGKVQATSTSINTSETRVTLNQNFGSADLNLQINPTPRLDVTMDLPSVRLADDTTLINFVPLDLLNMFPKTPGQVDIRIRELLYRQGAIRRIAIKLATDKGGVQHVEQAKALLPGLVDVNFSGNLGPSQFGRALTGKMTAVGDNLGETISWLGWPFAGQGAGWRSLSLKSDVRVSNVEIGFDKIDMRLDASKISGDASLRFSERLELGLDLDIERLDLGLYAPKSQPIDLARSLADQLDQFDSSIDLRFQRLTLQGLRLSEATFSARAKDRRFALESLTLKTVGDTAINIEGDIDLEEETVDLTTDLKSEFPTRTLRHLDVDLPSSSTRLEPLALSGWVTGALSGFDVGIRAEYDRGWWSAEGQAGWIDDQAHYDLEIKAKHPDHQAFASQFGVAPLIPARDAPGPLEFTLQLRSDPKGHWMSSGNAKLGPTSFTGRLDREAGENGEWDAKFSIGNPRKDSLAPLLSMIGLRSVGDWTPASMLGRLPSGIGFRTSWLQAVDGSLSIVAKGGLAGRGADLSARLDDGFLYIDQANVSLWNGGLSAELSLEERRNQPYLSMAIKLDDIDAIALADWLDMPRTIEGPITLELDATTVGRTVYDLIRSLSGSLRLEAGQGKLYGIGIPSFRKALREQLDVEQDAMIRPEDPLTMPLQHFELSGGIQRGIATFDQGRLAFDPNLGIEAEAVIDGTLDLLLWVAELELAIQEQGIDSDPMRVKIVGSPRRPQGVFADR